MQYYILKKLGKSRKEKNCFTDGPPEGINDTKLALDDGGTLNDVYPEDPYEVTMRLDEDHPKHIIKGDYISTTDSYVMVSSIVEKLLYQYSIDKCEFWPFTLLNHKGRLHSKDYRFVVTPQFNAINEELSVIKRDANGVVVGVRELVLDNKKLEDAPDMFRINDIGLMAFSEPLTEILQNEYTNFTFKEAEQG